MRRALRKESPSKLPWSKRRLGILGSMFHWSFSGYWKSLARVKCTWEHPVGALVLVVLEERCVYGGRDVRQEESATTGW